MNKYKPYSFVCNNEKLKASLGGVILSVKNGLYLYKLTGKDTDGGGGGGGDGDDYS